MSPPPAAAAAAAAATTVGTTAPVPVNLPGMSRPGRPMKGHGVASRWASGPASPSYSAALSSSASSSGSSPVWSSVVSSGSSPASSLASTPSTPFIAPALASAAASPPARCPLSYSAVLGLSIGARPKTVPVSRPPRPKLGNTGTRTDTRPVTLQTPSPTPSPSLSRSPSPSPESSPVLAGESPTGNPTFWTDPYICPSLRVTRHPHPARGLCVVTTEAIPAGTLLIREPPLLTLPSWAVTVNDLRMRWGALDDDEKIRFWLLAAGGFWADAVRWVGDGGANGAAEGGRRLARGMVPVTGTMRKSIGSVPIEPVVTRRSPKRGGRGNGSGGGDGDRYHRRGNWAGSHRDGASRDRVANAGNRCSRANYAPGTGKGNTRTTTDSSTNYSDKNHSRYPKYRPNPDWSNPRSRHPWARMLALAQVTTNPSVLRVFATNAIALPAAGCDGSGGGGSGGGGGGTGAGEFDAWGEGGAGIFECISRVNHSCVPNAGLWFRHDDRVGPWDGCAGEETGTGTGTGGGFQPDLAEIKGVMELRATRELARGEEVFITYTDPYQSLDRRLGDLEPYGFRCTCPACDCASPDPLPPQPEGVSPGLPGLNFGAESSSGAADSDDAGDTLIRCASASACTSATSSTTLSDDIFAPSTTTPGARLAPSPRARRHFFDGSVKRRGRIEEIDGMLPSSGRVLIGHARGVRTESGARHRLKLAIELVGLLRMESLLGARLARLYLDVACLTEFLGNHGDAYEAAGAAIPHYRASVGPTHPYYRQAEEMVERLRVRCVEAEAEAAAEAGQKDEHNEVGGSGGCGAAVIEDGAAGDGGEMGVASGAAECAGGLGASTERDAGLLGTERLSALTATGW